MKDNKEFLEVYVGIITDLYFAVEAVELIKAIVPGANGIEEAGYVPFFGAVQENSYRLAVLSVCNMYDTSRHNGKRSTIDELIRMLANASLIHANPVIEFLKQHVNKNKWAKIDTAPVSEASRLLPMIISNAISDQLERIRNIRNKEISHRGATLPATKTRATLQDIEQCIIWADKFLVMVSNGFLSPSLSSSKKSVLQHSDVKSSSQCLARVFDDLYVTLPRNIEANQRRRETRLGRLQDKPI